MQSTYDKAMQEVFKDEGGYTDDPKDPGGPTNWGITLEDARTYWKPGATSQDVKDMPKSVAEDIYSKHYAEPISYNGLPAGVDYAVLDYAINSGISRSVRTLQGLVGTTVDGQVGPNTLAATNAHNSNQVIDAIYDSRLQFLHGLSTWSHFGNGWNSRCVRGRALAHQLANGYSGSVKGTPPSVPVNPPKPIQKPLTLFGVIYELLLKLMGRS